jgi:hypothetical protein
LTIPESTAESRVFQKSVSANRVDCNATDDREVLSISLTSQIPCLNNNIHTYEDGYDSDWQLGPFYDAGEQMPLQEVSDERVQQEPPEIALEVNLPNF